MIKRPLKSPGTPITDEQLKNLTYPVACSYKLDGVRALCRGDMVLSAALKPIGNEHIQKCLSKWEFKGLDGELVVGPPNCKDIEDDVYHRTSGPVRRQTGIPDFKFYVFDDFCDTNLPYGLRWIGKKKLQYPPYIVILEQRLLFTSEDVILFEKESMEKGYEGIMVRTLDSLYKEGRATYNEKIIYKRKPIADDEAVIIGCFEQQENLNEKVTNELGLSTRSGHGENKVGKGTLGGFICQSSLWEKPFRCGTIIGGTKQVRKSIWDNKEKYMGKTIKYRYQKIGSIFLPRQPRMQGFRDSADMTNF